MGKGHPTTFAMRFRAQKSAEYPIAELRTKARSSRTDRYTRHRRIPERKQLNRYQAFIIASSLWSLRSKSAWVRAGRLAATSRTHKDALLVTGRVMPSNRVSSERGSEPSPGQSGLTAPVG